jgi:hypothetical protein
MHAFGPTEMKLMPFFAMTGAIDTSMSGRLRQFTATQGLEGVKWKVLPWRSP